MTRTADAQVVPGGGQPRFRGKARNKAARSVKLWGSLVALGGPLDGNDVGHLQGHNAPDLMPVQQRAAR